MVTITKENQWGELLVGRHHAWPNWFSNQKLFLGKEFEHAAKRFSQDGFDVDIHAVDKTSFQHNVVRLQYTTDIRKFVLSKLGDEPRRHYISRWLDELQSLPKYRAQLLEVVFDFESQTDQFSWNKDQSRISEQRDFLLHFLDAENVVPKKDWIEKINLSFPENDLDDFFYWATAWAPAPDKGCPTLTQRVFGNYPKMLMDFWDRVAFMSPDLVGFMWGPVFLHENFVLKNGHPVIEIPQRGPSIPDLSHK